MTWQLTYTENHQQSGESCLQLNHHKKNKQLRSWFGPLAQHLFRLIKKQLSSTTTEHHTVFQIEKQLAQHLLIQASFYHQRCLHQYQVYDDIKNLQLNQHNELCELLLFIRMSAQHPSQQTLQQLIDNQLPWYTDFNTEIKTLIDAKLIQKIGYRGLVFYDKNPYPHDHILDLHNQRLHDYTQLQGSLNQQQLLLCQTP